MKRGCLFLTRQNSRPTMACLGGAMVMLAGAGSQAQEALRSSLSYDQAVATHQNEALILAPDRPHLGPVEFSLGFYSSLSFEDNINYAAVNPQSDTILSGGVNAAFSWPATAQSEVSLDAGIGYAHYLKYSQYDNLNIAPNSLLNWNVDLGDVSLAFYDQFSYSQQVVLQPAISGMARFPLFDNNTGVRASWLPGHWFFSAGYSHDESFSDATTLDYLNRSSEYFFVRGAWRFAENTQAGLEASDSLTSYQSSSQSGNSSISIGPYAEWQITDAIHVTLRGGPTIYIFDSKAGASGGGSSLNSYYAGLQVSHRLTDFFSHQLAFQRDVNLGVNQGGNYLEEFTLSYSASYALTDRLRLAANASYQQGNQTFQNVVVVPPGFVFLLNQTEIYELYSWGAGVSWAFTDKFSGGLNYGQYIRKSNLAARGYTENTVTLTLNYAF